MANPAPPLCFGSRTLLLKQFGLDPPDAAAHALWLERWRRARDGQFLLVGSQDEVCGNKTCKATVEGDGSVSLRLLVPGPLREGGDDHLEIKGLRFGHGHADIVAAIGSANGRRAGIAEYQAETKEMAEGLEGDDLKQLRKKRRLQARAERDGPTTALTWRLVRDETGWTALVSVNRKHAVADWGFAHGALGIDLNVGFVSIMPVDRDGNPLPSLAVEEAIETAALSSDRAKAVMGEVVKRIVEMALAMRRPIVIEDLDLVKKKAALKDTCGPNLARRLSCFAYTLFKAMLRSRAARFGVRVVEVNPAFTSHMGRAKYARPLGISVHRAAAAMVARRGMGLSEGLMWTAGGDQGETAPFLLACRLARVAKPPSVGVCSRGGILGLVASERRPAQRAQLGFRLAFVRPSWGGDVCERRRTYLAT